MKTDDLIKKIITEAEVFHHRKPIDIKKIVITISIENGEKIIKHLNNLYYPPSKQIIYKSLTLYGYRIVFSEMISNNEILVGVLNELKEKS
jgi:hypothetical protein